MAQVPLADAARGLNLHPLNLLVRLRPVVGSLGECWPTVDQGYIETIRHLDGEREQHVLTTREPGDSLSTETAPPVPDIYSRAERRVIEKFWRKGKWGKLGMAMESIQKVCQDVQPDELDLAMSDLVRKGLMLAEGNRGPYSLNTQFKAEIDRIAELETKTSGGTARTK